MGQFPKATWIHHLPEYAENIKNIAHRLAEADFDLVMPCVMNPDGFLDYSSTVANVRETFEECDPLNIFAEECHQVGIRIHPWLCIFTEGQGSRLLQDNPDLVAIDKGGNPIVSGGAHRLGWVCPARDEVHDYEMAICQEIMSNYPIAGIHLDYVRHNDRFMCFCEHCREAFSAENNQDPVDLDREGELWSQWIDWRANAVTRFVSRLHEAASAEDIKVSAAVYAGYPSCVENLGQDWVKWAKDGLVDYLFPMNYSLDANQVIERTGGHIAEIDGACHIWEGIWNRPSMTTEMLIEQIYGAISTGSQGIVIFEYYGLSDADLEAIRQLG